MNDEQKEELAIFKNEHGTTLTSSVRALVMRGSTVEDARKLVLSREVVRAELLKEIEKEIDTRKEIQLEEPPQKAPRKPRGPNKSKTVEDKIELKDVPEEPEPDHKHIKIVQPKPKAKAKAKAKKEDESSDVNIIL